MALPAQWVLMLYWCVNTKRKTKGAALLGKQGNEKDMGLIIGTTLNKDKGFINLSLPVKPRGKTNRSQNHNLDILEISILLMMLTQSKQMMTQLLQMVLIKVLSGWYAPN